MKLRSASFYTQLIVAVNAMFINLSQPLVSPLGMSILFLSLDGRGKVRVRLSPFSDARKRELPPIFSNCPVLFLALRHPSLEGGR